VSPWNGSEDEDREETRSFVGLSNQGATCYMNSLLQTLYMTPEFRRNLYMWKYDPEKHGEAKDCIPFQLQLLFGKLQLSNRSYVETTGLTKSFQWDVRDGFQQHDVQEFCRVLFDAIELSVEATQQANMIKDLYEGTLMDYVECKNCKKASCREDKFLDISLTVRNEFDKIYNDSVEKALETYIKPDLLTGDNKYRCENCGGLQDAEKGLKFKTLPYILLLQLKRFDLDYNTMHRIKLNDYVKFPQVLNMNPYVHRSDLEQDDLMDLDFNCSPETDQIYFPHNIDSLELESFTYVGKDIILEDTDKQTIAQDHIAIKKQMEHKAQKLREERERLIKQYLYQGNNVYELFSVMIHSGSAMGGHYYAYIKSFENGKWYLFNDSTVKEIDEAEIEKTYGGKTKSWSGGYSANAYLLMYRRVDNEKNVMRVDITEVPNQVLEELEKDRIEEEQEEKLRQEKMNNLQIRIYHQDVEQTVQIKKDQTLGELKEMAIKEFDLEHIGSENVRLRSYSSYYKILQDTYLEDKTLEELSIFSYKTLAIETKDPQQEFQPYDPNMLSVKVVLWINGVTDNESSSLEEKINQAVTVAINKKDTIKQMMQRFRERFNIPIEKQKILKKSYMGAGQYIDIISKKSNWDQSLAFAKVFEGSIIYLEQQENTELKSKWQEEIEKDSNRYNIKFNNPEDTPNDWGHYEYRHSVSIPNNKTLQDLKEAIASKLGLSIDEFIIKRSSANGAEIKETSLKLAQANFMNGSYIFVEKGKPTRPDEYRIIFFQATEPNADEPDGNCYSFTELFMIPVSAKEVVSEVKRKICEKAKIEIPDRSWNPDYIRLRERNGEKLSKVLVSKDKMSQYHLYDKKGFAIQLLDRSEREPTENEIMIVVRRWYPSTWELSKPQEVLINKNWKIFEMGQALSALFSIPVTDI
jgi:ubiquitin carboxyl-terminal hydrolase 47